MYFDFAVGEKKTNTEKTTILIFIFCCGPTEDEVSDVGKSHTAAK